MLHRSAHIQAFLKAQLLIVSTVIAALAFGQGTTAVAAAAACVLFGGAFALVLLPCCYQEMDVVEFPWPAHVIKAYSFGAGGAVALAVASGILSPAVDVTQAMVVLTAVLGVVLLLALLFLGMMSCRQACAQRR